MPIPYNRLPFGICAKCQHEKRLQYNSKDGRICANCYKKKHPPTKKICVKCGFAGRPAYRTEAGVWCDTCYKKYIFVPNAVLETCDNCDQLKVLHLADPPLCHQCYLLLVYQPKLKRCTNCKEMRELKSRDHNGKPICNRCRQRIHESPVKTCVRCEHLRPVAKYLDREKTKPICKPCWCRADRTRKANKKIKT